MTLQTLIAYCNRYQLADCVVGLLLVIFTSIIYVIFPPYCRPFSWTDPTINYPYITQVLFPSWTLFLFLLLALCLYGVTVISSGGNPWVWIKAQLLAFVTQLLVVSLIKLYAGRLRPDYLNRLRSLGFSEDSYAKSGITNMTSTDYYCSLGDTYDVLREGRLSFPSGHSSSSFAVFVFMSCFLSAQLQLLTHGGGFVRLLVALSPTTIAFLCAVSRTRDYWHNFDDVVAGAIIGTFSALLCFCNAFRITSNGTCIERRAGFGEEGEHTSADQRATTINVVAV